MHCEGLVDTNTHESTLSIALALRRFKVLSPVGRLVAQ